MNMSSQFVHCPRCDGSGKDDPGYKGGAGKNIVCNNCGGVGLGSFIKSNFLYWGYEMSPAKILVRQSKVVFDWGINIIFLLLGLGGITALIIWLKNNALVDDGKLEIGTFLSFWGVKDNFILYCWLGILFLLFFYFRLQRAMEKRPPVKLFSYQQWKKLGKKEQDIPNNWQELKSHKQKIDVSKSFEPKLIKAIEQAYHLALSLKHTEVIPAHVLSILVEDKKNKSTQASLGGQGASDLFARLGVYQGKLGPKITNALKQLPANENTKYIPAISKELKQSFIEAYFSAQDYKNAYVQFSDLLVPLIENDRILQDIFTELNVKIEDVENVSVWSNISRKLAIKSQERKINLRLDIKKKINLSTLAVATPILNYFCKDLVEELEFEVLDEFVDRDETEYIFKNIESKIKQIVLNSPEGAGKRALIRVVAQHIIDGNVPKVLQNKRLLKLNLDKLSKEADQMAKEKKLLVVVDEARKAGNVVLVIENLTNELWQIISRYPNPFYILVTAQEQLLDVNPAKTAIIQVPAPRDNLAIQILSSKAALMELEKKVYFNYEAVEAAWTGSKTFYPNKNSLLKAIELIQKSSGKNITKKTVAEVVSAEIKVPVTKVIKGEK